MILDTLQNIDAYAKLNPLFPDAFRHLRELSARKDLPHDRLELDGDRIYAVFVRGAGKATADARLETHRRYIDIQYTVEGADRIGWLPAAACAAGDGYNEAKDVEFFSALPVSGSMCQPATRPSSSPTMPTRPWQTPDNR